jgi:hypothetical protein
MLSGVGLTVCADRLWPWLGAGLPFSGPPGFVKQAFDIAEAVANHASSYGIWREFLA